MLNRFLVSVKDDFMFSFASFGPCFHVLFEIHNKLFVQEVVFSVFFKMPQCPLVNSRSRLLACSLKYLKLGIVTQDLARFFKLVHFDICQVLILVSLNYFLGRNYAKIKDFTRSNAIIQKFIVLRIHFLNPFNWSQ